MSKRKNRKARKKTPKLKLIYTPKQLAAVDLLSDFIRNKKGQKRVTLGSILKAAGYSDSICQKPALVTKRKGFQALLRERLSDDLLTKTHKQLIRSARLDHRVFPKSMSDKEIKGVIESIEGCKIRKIKHGETANHAYFWTPDNQSRSKAIDMAYKIRNKYPAEKHKVEALVAVVEIIKYA